MYNGLRIMSGNASSAGICKSKEGNAWTDDSHGLEKGTRLFFAARTDKSYKQIFNDIFSLI